jgi:hypothetical protein
MNENPNESEVQSQNRLLLRHLQMGGTITGIEALNLYGCFRLPSRIWDLKQAGHNIVGKFIKTPTGKRVMQYRLVEAS